MMTIFKAWCLADRKARSLIVLSLSDEHLEHVQTAATAKEMWVIILHTFERHTLLHELATRRRFYTAAMNTNGSFFTVCVPSYPEATVKSMDVTIDEKEVAMAVLNGMPPRFDNLIVVLDALGNEDTVFTLEFVKSRWLQEDDRAQRGQNPMLHSY